MLPDHDLRVTAEPDTPLPPPAPDDAQIELAGPQLILARLAWVAVTILSTIVFLAKIGWLITQLPYPSPSTSALLNQAGISPEFRATYFAAMECLFGIVFYIVGIALVRHKSDYLPTMLVSIALITFGASGVTLPVLVEVSPQWIVPVALMGFIYRTTFVAFLYVFPDGRFVPRWLKWLLIIWVVIAALVVVTQYAPVATEGSPVLNLLIDVLLLVSILYAQIYRYRRVSTPRQRAQTRWVVYGLSIAIPLSMLAEIPQYIVTAVNQPGPAYILYEFYYVTLSDIGLTIIPVTIGIAILRHRLFDIDIIINRTLVYVPLTAIMAGIFASTIALTQKLLLTLSGQTSDAAAVLATLVTVAVFTPVRNRIQEAVDKSFKDTADPSRRLKAFSEQIRLRLTPIQAAQILRRLLDETITIFDAAGGAAYLDDGQQRQLVHKARAWSAETKLEVAIRADGEVLGALALCEKNNGHDYTQQDRKALEQVALIVGNAIKQDRGAT